MTLLENNTNLSTFDKFAKKYDSSIINICPYLGRFSIKIFDLNEYVAIKDSKTITIDNVENEPLSYYIIQKDKTDASTVDAGIVFNRLICKNLKFSEEEVMAAIAHEIGHIMFFYHEENDGNKQTEEIFADSIACQLGFKEPLLRIIDKLISSDRYTEDLHAQMRTRKFWIANY